MWLIREGGDKFDKAPTSLRIKASQFRKGAQKLCEKIVAPYSVSIQTVRHKGKFSKMKLIQINFHFNIAKYYLLIYWFAPF